MHKKANQSIAVGNIIHNLNVLIEELIKPCVATPKSFLNTDI